LHNPTNPIPTSGETKDERIDILLNHYGRVRETFYDNSFDIKPEVLICIAWADSAL
jgi:hypothetical protein